MSRPFGLYQKNNQGSWMLPIRLDDGKRVIRSTETSDLKEACRLAPDIIYRVKNGIEKQEKEGWTLHQLWERFIKEKESAGAPSNSIRNYRQSQARWEAHLTPDFKISEISREHIDGFIKWREKEGNKVTSTRLYLIMLATTLNMAREAGQSVPKNKQIFPSALMGRKVLSPRKRFLSPHEIEKLINAAQPQHVDYIIGYIFTGCRKEELFAIRKCDVDFSRNQILIRGTKNNQSFASIPMHPDLRAMLQRRVSSIQDSDLVFPPIRDIARNIKRAAARAGIEKVTTHDLRRTTGSLLASAGVDIRQIAFMLRHKDINTTISTYAWLTAQACQDITSKLPSIPDASGASFRKKSNQKPFVQLDMEGNEIARWESVIDAVRATGIRKISACLNGAQLSAGGFRWCWEEKNGSDTISPPIDR